MGVATQVAFNNVPGDIRVPIFAAELNAGPPPFSGTSRQVLLGRKLAGSPVAALKATNLGSADPAALFGFGSMLADMAVFARQHNPSGEIWAMDAGDPAGGVAAAGAITFAGTATSSGTLVRYIAGERYSVGVAVGDTAAIVAAAFVTAIGKGYTKFNRVMGAPVTAAVDGTTPGKVDLTARHTGTEGNGIRIEAGLDGDEVDPAGITATITAMSGGAGDVDVAAALAALGAQPFDWITSPYAETAQLNAARDFLSDSGSGRWAPLVALDGHYITATEGNLSTLTTFGSGRNDRHTTILGSYQAPHPLWSWAAALGGTIAFYKNLGRPLKTAIEIARPLQTVVLQGLRPPKDPTARFAIPDRDSLYRNGISAVVWRDDDQPALDRVITTYRVNDAGLPDITFLDIEAIAIGCYVKRYMKNALLGTYPRHVLREDNPRGIQGVATPPQLRATTIHAYTELSEIAGIVRQPDLFAKYLIVDADYENDRANFYMPVSKAAALRVFGVNITLFADLNDTNASGL